MFCALTNQQCINNQIIFFRTIAQVAAGRRRKCLLMWHMRRLIISVYVFVRVSGTHLQSNLRFPLKSVSFLAHLASALCCTMLSHSYMLHTASSPSSSCSASVDDDDDGGALAWCGCVVSAAFAESENA